MAKVSGSGNALSVSQHLIWLGQQLAPASPMNNMAFTFTFQKTLDEVKMQQAFRALVTACDAMRTVFIGDGEVVTQHVLSDVGFTLPVKDFSDTADPQVAVNAAIQREVTEVFDLSERLFSATLFKLSATEYILYLNQHHLITDGWGYSVQLDFLMKAYRGVELPVLPGFADYLAGLLPTEKRIAEQKEWEKRAEGFPTPPALLGRVNQQLSSKSSRITRQLSAQETETLHALCLTPEVRSWTLDLSLFTVFATALFVYTYRLSGQQDLTIGAPAHNRLSKPDQQTAGLFMELFPLNVTVAADDTFSTLLQKVKAESMSFLRYAQPGTSSATTGRSFNVVLNYINRAFASGEAPEFISEWLHPGHTEPGHHFKLQVYDFDATGRLTLCFDVNDAVIEPAFQTTCVSNFMALLRQMLRSLDTPVAQLPEAEIRRLNSFNAIDPGYRKDVSVVDLVADGLAKRPEAIAVRFGEATLTGKQLEEQSSQVANYLLAQGVGPEDIVGVCLERSLEMIVALLGVIRAGAAYLPIDPGFPEERITLLCADAGAKHVLTTSRHLAHFAGFSAGFASAMDDRTTWPDVVGTTPLLHPESIRDRNLRPRSDQLFYVLYTSGSTGKPKGVMNQHDGLVNRLLWMQKQFPLIAGEDVVLQKTTFTFDVSVWELFWPLMVGCELVFAQPGGEKDGDYLRQTIEQYGVTTLHFVPPMLEVFLLKSAQLPSLKRVICSGEALTAKQVNAFNAAYPQAELHNLYGPTEAAIDVTHWPAPRGKVQVQHVPIGRPIDNTPIRIYGPNRELRPVGVPGELYIGGVQVARGYLGRPELTAEKFVNLDGQRWYRTGDLVRWLPDGNIDFLGRIDHQVKLRGFRIELGEIENQLLEISGVKQAIVLLRKDQAGEPALVGYLTGEVEQAALRAVLRAKVPAYMVPGAFVVLDQLPLLKNGKVNRKALPDPELSVAGEGPQDEFEEMLHEVWTEVFQLDSIGRKVHFLDLGGHSLTGIRIMSLVNDAFELELPVNTIFRFPTIAALGEHIESTLRRLLAEMEDTDA